jgi:hypothetical protein
MIILLLFFKMQKAHRNCKNHTKNAKNDISGITDILPRFSPYWLSPITSFHHIGEVGDNRYYRDILESVLTLTLLSLVFRTEDVCQRYNQYTETFRSSQSGFPLLTPTMQAGQDSDGGMGGSEEMCALHAVVVLWF